MWKPATIRIFPKNKNYTAATKWLGSWAIYLKFTLQRVLKISLDLFRLLVKITHPDNLFQPEITPKRKWFELRNQIHVGS